MLCFSFTDSPSAPKDLSMPKFDKSSVTLKWKAPEKDGGNPIQGKRVMSWKRMEVAENYLNSLKEEAGQTLAQDLLNLVSPHQVVTNILKSVFIYFLKRFCFIEKK